MSVIFSLLFKLCTYEMFLYIYFISFVKMNKISKQNLGQVQFSSSKCSSSEFSSLRWSQARNATQGF